MVKKRSHEQETGFKVERDSQGILWIENSADGKRILQKLHQVETPSDMEVLPHLFRLMTNDSNEEDLR